MRERESGILLPIICLPSPFGIGDIGPAARRFVDFLEHAGQRYFQVLPINATTRDSAHNPYSGPSAYAGNRLLISPADLVAQGLIGKDSVRHAPDFPEGIIDYDAVSAFKDALLDEAWETHRRKGDTEALAAFAAQNAGWLDDYTLFVGLRDRHDRLPFHRWPEALRDRHPEALAEARHELRASSEKETFVQWLFFEQWRTLKAYANARGIALLGDVPIYVDGESAEVWAHPQLFQLDEHKRPRFVSGAPPDQFSATGQYWGHPLYDWDAHEAERFAFWVKRFAHNLSLFDYTRVDHFRGFAGYWAIPQHARDARAGFWQDAPGAALFAQLKRCFGELPLFVEDLGVITDDVRALRDAFDLPGMAVLLFAFAEDLHLHGYLPHNHRQRLVVYTGTHDTQTARGWWETEATAHEKHQLGTYLGHYVYPETVAEAFVHMALSSRADTAIIPIQDWLSLGAHARINTPSATEGNYRFRLGHAALTSELSAMIREQTERTGRLRRER